MDNHFVGMAEESFSYVEFEATRHTKIDEINNNLGDADRRFLISFKEGNPAWAEFGFEEFEPFPAVQWKLRNIRNLRATKPAKHQEHLQALKDILEHTTL
jgi:hypothetical protein